MSPSSEQFQQASDPATPAQTLADLAAAHPELRPAILANPAAYEGLREWIGQQSAPAPAAQPVATQPAFAQPMFAQPAYALATHAPGARWQEPSRALDPSGYGARTGLALAAVGLGALISVLRILLLPLLPDDLLGYLDLNQYTSISLTFQITASLPALLVLVAVVVLPTTPVRRLVAALLSASAVAAPVVDTLWWSNEVPFYLFGGAFLAATPAAALLAAWFVARMRPGVAFALLPLPVIFPLVGFLYGWFVYWDFFDPVQLLCTIATPLAAVGAAWIGRAIAAVKGRGR